MSAYSVSVATGEYTLASQSSADSRYTYDPLRRVVEHRYANLDKAFQHQYDAVGNRTRLTYPDGKTMTYTYDAANEQVSAVDSEAGAFTLAYDETGMRTVLGYPNGLVTHSTYDLRDRVLSLITTGEKGTNPSQQAPDFVYTYDPSGNR